ncbi:MAG: hypothetical protein IPL33_21775 [Sphingobacteriales bacterium]|nr:hypothetical protein [Sphingobacteriales bacterium]
MEKTKLFALLRCLDPKERRWVAGYFCQPYLAEKHATWRQLLNYLLDQTHQSQPKIDRKTIFIILFGIKTPYDDLRMRHIATNVLQQVETALAYYYAQRDDVLWLPLQTLRLYSRKQLAKHYNGAIENIKRHLSENEYRHADYFLQKYRYFNLQEQFNNNRTDPAKQIALVEASNSLDVFYIAAKLRMMAALGTPATSTYDRPPRSLSRYDIVGSSAKSRLQAIYRHSRLLLLYQYAAKQWHG